MSNARDLRLLSDYESLKNLVNESNGKLAITSTSGSPPDTYTVEYRCRSIEAVAGSKPIYASVHIMRIKLPARYPLPSAPPRLEMLTPVFNPHIYPNRQVCLGSWQTSEYLDELVARVGALLQFDRRIINMRDPANPDAMEWTKKNLILLPTDTVIYGAQDIEPKSAYIPGQMEPVTDSYADTMLEWVDE
jgi:ubiquitin-protein ligase